MLSWFLLSGVALALIGYLTLITQPSSALRRQLPLIVPAQAGLSSEVVRFRARGEVLTIGAWHIPTPQAAQAVIIAYNSHECRDPQFAANALDLAIHLRRNGFTVLMLDLRDPSEGGASRIAYGSRERRDLLGAVDWLLEHGYAPGTIGVLGVSIGAIAGIGAANGERSIGALIVVSASAKLRPLIRTGPRHFSGVPRYFLPDGRLLTANDPVRQRVAALLDVIDRRPVLIKHAKGDQFVPVEHSRTLVRKDNAELWVADCASQLGDFGINSHGYRQQVTRFFCRALGGRQTPDAGDASAGHADRDMRRATHAPRVDDWLQADEYVSHLATATMCDR